MPLGANYNYDLENQRLQQQLSIVNALQANTLKPMEVPTAGAGQVQARVNPLAAMLTPMLSAYLGHKGREAVHAQQDELSARYKDDLVRGIEDFHKKSVGGWTNDRIAPSDNADITQVNGSDNWNYQAPDQKAAIMSAMASNHPVLQQLGQAGLAQMYKTDPMSQLLGLGGGPTGPQPPAEVLQSGQYTVNGQAPGAGNAMPGGAGAPGGGAGGGMPPMGTLEDRLKHFFPLVPPEQARALLAADPTGKTLAEENAHRGRPIVAGDNLFQQVAPGVVTLPQGAVEARGAVKEADASTADRHELVTATDPATGAPTTRTKAQAIAMTGQGTPSGQELLAQLHPDDQLKILKGALESGDTVVNVDLPGRHGQRVKGVINLGRGNGNGFVSGQAPALAAEQKGYAESLAKARETIDADADAAMSVKARVQEMRDASQNFTSGNFAPLKEKLGGIAIAMGMDPAAVNSRMGNISSMQMFNKEATQLAFDMVKQLGSREAAAVVNQAIKSNANLENQPLANKGMLDVIEGMADWKMAKQEGAQTWADTHNGSLAGFQTYFNKTSPITKFIHVQQQTSQAPMGATAGPSPVGKQPSGAAPRPAEVPMSIEDYLKKHGAR